MVRSYSHASVSRGLGTALENAVGEAKRILLEYDEIMLGGEYDAEKDHRLDVEGFAGWCCGTVRFDVPRQPFLFQDMGCEQFGVALGAFQRQLTGTLEVLQRQGATPLSSTPTAEAFCYWLRRCLAAAATQLATRQQYRGTDRGGIAQFGTFVDFVLIDVQEVIVPWGVVRDFTQPILVSARQVAWAREDRSLATTTV